MIHAFQSLNSNVRGRIQAQIMILVPDEQETDTKNRTSTNEVLSSRTPLEIVKKTFQAFELINSNVRAKIQAKITILVSDEQEKDAKNRTSMNSASELVNPLEMVKKHVWLLNRSNLMFELGFRPKLRFGFQMSSKQTRKIDHQKFKF